MLDCLIASVVADVLSARDAAFNIGLTYVSIRTSIHCNANSDLDSMLNSSPIIFSKHSPRTPLPFFFFFFYYDGEPHHVAKIQWQGPAQTRDVTQLL